MGTIKGGSPKQGLISAKDLPIEDLPNLQPNLWPLRAKYGRKERECEREKFQTTPN